MGGDILGDALFYPGGMILVQITVRAEFLMNSEVCGVHVRV